MMGCGWEKWAQGLDHFPAGNRNLVERLDCLEECVDVGRSFGWGTAGHAQVCKYLDDDGRVLNGGDDRHRSATVRTVGQVSNTCWSNWAQLIRACDEGVGAAPSPSAVFGAGVGLAGHDLGPEGGVGGEHAMEANEMQAGPY